MSFKSPFLCSNTQSLTPITNPDHPHPHRSSLRILGSVGEPINPEAWRWYYSVVGEERCPIVDTYWQTETGSFMITPLPGATPLKPGSATLLTTLPLRRRRCLRLLLVEVVEVSNPFPLTHGQLNA